MVKTVTVTETITRLALDAPPPTNIPWPPGPHHQDPFASLESATSAVGVPAFTSTIHFLLASVAIYLATAAVTYLLLRTKAYVVRFCTGEAASTRPEDDQTAAMAVARCITVSHFLTVLVLAMRMRQALSSLAPVSYEVCTLVLGIEAAVSVVVAGIYAVVTVLEGLEGEEKGREKEKRR